MTVWRAADVGLADLSAMSTRGRAPTAALVPPTSAQMQSLLQPASSSKNLLWISPERAGYKATNSNRGPALGQSPWEKKGQGLHPQGLVTGQENQAGGQVITTEYEQNCEAEGE